MGFYVHSVSDSSLPFVLSSSLLCAVQSESTQAIGLNYRRTVLLTIFSQTHVFKESSWEIFAESPFYQLSKSLRNKSLNPTYISPGHQISSSVKPKSNVRVYFTVTTLLVINLIPWNAAYRHHHITYLS